MEMGEEAAMMMKELVYVLGFMRQGHFKQFPRQTINIDRCIGFVITRIRTTSAIFILTTQIVNEERCGAVTSKEKCQKYQY